MSDANKMRATLRLLAVVALTGLVAGCETTPTVSASGGPSVPGVPGAPGVPGVPGLPGPTAGGVERPGAPTPGTVTAPAPRPGATRGRAGDAGQGKTDDEILAEALDEFGKKNKPSQRGGDGASGSGQSPQAGDAAGGASGGGQPPQASGAAGGNGGGANGGGQSPQASDAAGGNASGASGSGQSPQASGATGNNGGGVSGDNQTPSRQRAGPPSGGTERAQALNRELREGLAEFDRAMLSEQEAIARRANSEGYAGALPEGDFAAGGGDPAADHPAQTAMLDSGPGGPTGSLKGRGDIPTQSRSEVPPDLVDAAGDDIIARQLREAAMKEQDPELRKKLWDEYRKYKRGLK